MQIEQLLAASCGELTTQEELILTITTRNTGQAIADALEKGGVESDAPDPIPNPYSAAKEAFYVWNGKKDPTAWGELRNWLTGPSVPRVAYHRKLAELCLRALRHNDMPQALVEPISYARGYFDARVEVAARLKGGHDE